MKKNGWLVYWFVVIAAAIYVAVSTDSWLGLIGPLLIGSGIAWMLRNGGVTKIAKMRKPRDSID